MYHLICKIPSCDLDTDPDLLKFGKHWGEVSRGIPPFCCTSLELPQVSLALKPRYRVAAGVISNRPTTPSIVYREWVRI